MRAAQGGDAAAVGALCEKYRPAVVGYLARRGLAGEAEDVAQEVLLALVQSALQRADSASGTFRGLVFSIARNRLLKHLEKRQAAKRGEGRTQPLGDEDPAAPPERDSEFDREWLANLLRTATARLAKEHPLSFTALQRFLMDGVPQATVATELGIPVEQVKKQVYRAKRRIARYLREEIWTYAGSRGEYESEVRYLSGLLGDALPETEE